MPTTPRHLHQRQEEGYCLISRLPRPLSNAAAADRPPLYVLPLLLRCAAFSTVRHHQRVTTLPLRKGQRPRIRSETLGPTGVPADEAAEIERKLSSLRWGWCGMGLGSSE